MTRGNGVVILMEIIKVNSKADIRKYKDTFGRVISSHGVVVYPTDTVYGIGCSIYDPLAVRKLFKIKDRRLGKNGLPVLASDIATACKIATMNSTARVLAERFWPGPLTLILPLKDARVASLKAHPDGEIGIRIPKSEIAIAVASMFNGLVVGTSANISGKKPLESVDEIKAGLPDADLVISSRIPKGGKPSTVFDVARLMVLREGAIKQPEIDAALTGV